MSTKRTVEQIVAEMRRALEEQRIVTPDAFKNYCIVTVAELAGWADALDAAPQREPKKETE
jgi:hypothetical protein